MKFYNNLSIKNKLVVLVLAVSLLAVALGGSLVIINNIQTFRKDMVSSTLTISQFVADACAASLGFGTYSEVTKELEKLKGMPIVENAHLYEFATEAWREEKYGKFDKSFEPPKEVKTEIYSEFKDGYLHVFFPAKLEGEELGVLYLRASTRLLEKKIRDYLLTMGVGLLILIVLIYFLAYQLQKGISGPILKLANVTTQITTSADYSVRVNKDGKDEISTLYKGFNNMLEQIQVREKQRDEAEEEQRRLMGELDEKNKELEQVVYVTSHDLRSPLVNIQGFSKELGYSLEDLSELLNKEGIPNEIKEQFSLIIEEDIPDSLKYILSSTTKMDTLLTGLLKLSRVGRTATTFDNVDMNLLFSEISNAFEFHFKDKGVTFTMAEDMPPCYGNDVQLNQLFSNLLNNAIKYLDPQRPGVIDIFCHAVEEKHVVYAVKDNGVGIKKDHQKKVFEIFHRLNPSETQGEGLGLSIVNKIVSRHNGKIWVESEFGVGSTFFVRLKKPKEEENIEATQHHIIQG